jgi:hypothetical protein
LHNEELHNFYASTNIIRMIKSWSMRWVCPCSSPGEKVLAARQKERDNQEDLVVGGRIILSRVSVTKMRVDW